MANFVIEPLEERVSWHCGLGMDVHEAGGRGWWHEKQASKLDDPM